MEAADALPFDDSAPLVLLTAASTPLDPPGGDSATRVLLGAASAALGVPLPSGAESALGSAAEVLRGGAGLDGACLGAVRQEMVAICMQAAHYGLRLGH